MGDTYMFRLLLLALSLISACQPIVGINSATATASTNGGPTSNTNEFPVTITFPHSNNQGDCASHSYTFQTDPLPPAGEAWTFEWKVSGGYFTNAKIGKGLFSVGIRNGPDGYTTSETSVTWSPWKLAESVTVDVWVTDAKGRRAYASKPLQDTPWGTGCKVVPS
jgi:hypothetical protein